MKKKYINLIIIFLIIIILTLLNKFEIIKTNRQILKEMTSTDLETNLNAQINKLNDEHTEYRTYIQECKTKIATALTNEGVETSDQILLNEMAEKIPQILQARTSDADATADNITAGKTAYVNGVKITGTGADNNSYYNQGIQEGGSGFRVYAIGASSYPQKYYFDVSEYSTLTYNASALITIILYTEFYESGDSITILNETSGTGSVDISGYKSLHVKVKGTGNTLDMTIS